MNNFLYSYTDFINERANFVRVDRTGVNRYDSPANLYFKLVFYFTDESGLLGISGVSEDENPILKTIKNITAAFRSKKELPTSIKNNVFRNTAYNYLLLNDELERAEYLKNFIMLLSDINCDSPWYFKEINGLDTALERKVFTDGEFKIEDTRKQITIKCLHDAYDNRIGTLLDLYRAACFSYQNKKEIIPANLRKFNMGVLVFNAPIRGKGGKSGDPNNIITIPDDTNGGISYYYIPSAKLIELRNCEIDYNSSKTAFGTLNNSEEFNPEYTITIHFDDCYESRYNEIMQEVITDFIKIDTNKDRIDSSLRPDSLLDLFTFGMSALSDKSSMKIMGANKGYWTNTDISKNDLYTTKAIEKVNIFPDSMNFPGKNLLTTQVNNISDKINKVTQLPSLDLLKENIHDNGSVNQYGDYEYLNRTSGMNGVLGGLVGQGVGIVAGKTKNEVSKLYLGNVYKMSVRDISSYSDKLFSGDIAGIASSAKAYEKNNKEIESKSIKGEKISGYSGKDNLRTQFLTKMNQKKSIYNNL